MTAEQWIDLVCHPATPLAAVRAIKVLVRRSAGELRMSFCVDGEIERIKVPSPSAPRINTQLWRHTCFEAFIAVEGRTAYHEFNFAPSGEWAVYAFSGYRDGGPLADETMRPRIGVRSTDTLLDLDAGVSLDTISAIHPHAPLRIGLSAIVESDGRLSYWALRHPAGKPDFHNAGGFALPIGPSCVDR